ncbi:MAG: hypothetical protein IJ673_01900, partial [Treponema sp.]|nr:hypothetical protein [Treponema sp.]
FDSEKSRKTYNINDDPYFKELLVFSSRSRKVDDSVGDKVARDFVAYPLDLTFGNPKIFDGKNAAENADDGESESDLIEELYEVAAHTDEVQSLEAGSNGSMFSFTKFSTGDNVSDVVSDI